jgi:hypothetical protein
MKNRANYLICLMEILFELEKIRHLLKINEGEIYKPDMKKKDYFDILDTICDNIDYIVEIINNFYYYDEIKIKSTKYEYTETHSFINNKIYEYKQNHIDKQYKLIKEALTKIIELTNIYNDFYKDDRTGEKFYKDYQYQYKININYNDIIEISYCLGELELDDMRAISGIGETEMNMLINKKPKITKKFLDSIKSILKL